MSRLKYIILFPLLTIIITGCREQVPDALKYIDQIKPSTTPLLFAKGFITLDTISEYGSVFNSEYDEFYFAIDSAGKSAIKYSGYNEGNWTLPKLIITDSIYSFNDPFLSNDDQRLYYISDKPRDINDTIKDFDIWYSKRIANGWSAPINAGLNINSDAQEYYISFTENGSMYFASNKEKSSKRQHDFDIYKSEFSEGEFKFPKKISDSINTKRYEADVFIAPDESYIIYCSAKKSGLGKGDLYINFKDANGNWTQTLNMGEPINSKGHEICPFVTKDGKYFFYTSNQDLYWVSTEIFKELKTNSSIKAERKE